MSRRRPDWHTSTNSIWKKKKKSHKKWKIYDRLDEIDDILW